MTAQDIAEAHITWHPAYRIIPTRFPSINLFDRVATPEDFDALYALEALTNDRIRDEVGLLNLVPEGERLFGPGSGPIMAALTHPNPSGSRFSDGSFGVFYCARDRDTAIAETRHHSSLFLASTQEPAIRLQMRLYSVHVAGDFADLRSPTYQDSGLFHPSDYRQAQVLGGKLRETGSAGVVYPSVRYAGGECVAGFRTGPFSRCIHAAHLEYNWDGRAINAVFNVSQIQ